MALILFDQNVAAWPSLTHTGDLAFNTLWLQDLLSSAFGGGLDSLAQGLEDVLALASAPNVVNLNISVSIWGLQAKQNLLYKEQMIPACSSTNWCL